MPLAQSSELPPPRPIDRVDAERSGEGAAGLDHRGIGVLAEVVKRDDADAGCLQRCARPRRRTPAATRPAIGDEQDAREPEIAGERPPSRRRRRRGAKMTTRRVERLKIEAESY